MRTTLAILVAAVAVSNTGCLTLTPVGPMARWLGAKPRPTTGPDAIADATSKPMPPPAAPPPLPTLLVTPGEVTAANHPDIVAKLKREMDADAKALETLPQYAEVSTVSGPRE